MPPIKPVRVEKPWGYEVIWAHTGRYVGKILHINKGHALSLQYHLRKDETVHVLSGEMLFQTGGEGEPLVATPLRPGGAFPIRPLLRHRSTAPASPADYARLPLETLEAGSSGTRNALQLAEDCGARLIHASTSEVYGDPLQHPQSEEYFGNVNPIGPRACYDEAKRFAEALIS